MPVSDDGEGDDDAPHACVFFNLLRRPAMPLGFLSQCASQQPASLGELFGCNDELNKLADLSGSHHSNSTTLQEV